MEMNLKRSFFLGSAGALAICGLALLSTGQRISAIVDSQVDLYDKPIDGRVIKMLNRGDVMGVVECEDLKHYIVPVVLLNGQRAYLHKGDYRLVRKTVWQFGGGPISFSCQ